MRVPSIIPVIIFLGIGFLLSTEHALSAESNEDLLRRIEALERLVSDLRKKLAE
jgi:hypothetical protein